MFDGVEIPVYEHFDDLIFNDAEYDMMQRIMMRDRIWRKKGR